MISGRLYLDGRLVLPQVSKYKDKLLREFHETPMGKHSGILQTYHRLKLNVYWKGMKEDVQRFVKECEVCQRQKYETTTPARLLSPLDIPQMFGST